MKRSWIPVRMAMIALIIVVPLSIYIPVHQAAKYRAVAFEISRIEREIDEIDEQNRVLVGEIAVLSSPDRIIPLAEQDFGEERAEEDDITIIEER